MNYYVPIQQDVVCKKQDAVCKKQDEVCKNQTFWLYPKREHLILGRRFALTSSKYLEVGIRESLFETNLTIRIGDDKGNCISMSEVVWAALIEGRSNFEQWMQLTPKARPWEIYHDLTIEITKIGNENVLRFTKDVTKNDPPIYLKPSNVLFMLDLEHCVANAIESIWLHKCKVHEKFNQFVSIIRQNRITTRCDALKKLREVYDKTSIIECELLMYAIDNIVYAATYLYTYIEKL